MPKKPRPLTWAQRQVMERLPADRKWRDVMQFGPCATASVIRGLVSRGLIEHKQKDPNSPIAHLEWITQGQIRRAADQQDAGELK